jgi:hypothetical protein
LYLVDVPGFLPLYYQGNTDDLGDGRDIQEESLSGFDEARTRGLEMSILRSSSAVWASSVQQKELDFLITCTGGAHIPPAGTRNG